MEMLNLWPACLDCFDDKNVDQLATVGALLSGLSTEARVVALRESIGHNEDFDGAVALLLIAAITAIVEERASRQLT